VGAVKIEETVGLWSLTSIMSTKSGQGLEV
jgi:hypothetical protein